MKVHAAEGDTVALSLNTTRQKIKNLRANPAANVFLLDLAVPYRYLELRGDAETGQPLHLVGDLRADGGGDLRHGLVEPALVASRPLADQLDVAGLPVLAVKRYDRQDAPAGDIPVRVHQEDGCQATAMLRAQAVSDTETRDAVGIR